MHQEINKIREKMGTTPWPKYLKSLSIEGIRGWNGQEVRFPFPITVIAGENGSGKSTVLKAAATAYSNPVDKKKHFYPSSFFPNTAWDRITRAKINYKIHEGNQDRDYSYSKLTERWRTSVKRRSERSVFWQDIARTLPIEATAGYVYLAKSTAQDVSADQLSDPLLQYYSSIMGRDYGSARTALSNAHPWRKVGVVSYQRSDISQFHQGAGEDATFDLLSTLQNIPDTSLLLIDEVEASLHPRSQRRLIHFLLWLSRTKHIQAIISTHSPYVLEELPPEARVFLMRGTEGVSVLYGVSPEFALSRMDDIDKPDLYMFVEDNESKELVQCILNKLKISDRGIIKIQSLGPAHVIETVGRYSKNFPIPFLGVLDAEQNITPNCIKLPGSQAPEKQIFGDIISRCLNDLSDRLALKESDLRNALIQSMTLRDHHVWLDHVSSRLNISKEYIWTSMCLVWLTHCVTEQQLDSLSVEILRKLPTGS